MGKIARGSPLEGAKVTSYKQCLDVLCDGGLAVVGIAVVQDGAKYVAYAAGNGDEPH